MIILREGWGWNKLNHQKISNIEYAVILFIKMFNEQLQTLIKEKIPAQNRMDNELSASGDFTPGKNSVGKLRIRMG